jgi:hypothetical protein
MNHQAAELFLRYSASRLDALASWIDECLSRLTVEQLWWRGGEAQNAIGNLVIHLCANVHQRITLTLGKGGRDTRDRDGEFNPRLTGSPAELRRQLSTTISEAVAVLRQFPAGQVTEHAPRPGYDRSILENIYTVMEHFAMHTGQIMYATKLLTKQGLGELSRSKKAAPGAAADAGAVSE